MSTLRKLRKSVLARGPFSTPDLRCFLDFAKEKGSGVEIGQRSWFLGADQKDRGLWGRECVSRTCFYFRHF